MASPRLASLPLALIALASAAPGVGATRTPTVKAGCSTADGKGFVYAAKPKTCMAYVDAAGASAVLSTTKLKWKSWGAAKATATGSLTTPVLTGKATLTATKLKKCTTKISIYARIEVREQQSGGILTTLKVPCPSED